MLSSAPHILSRTTSGTAASRRGAVLVLTVFLLIVLFGMVAFSVDVAYMHLTRAKLRAATDAAARAAGESLSRTQNMEQARQAAKDIALANQVAGEPLILDDDDIVAGAVTINSTGAWTFTEGGTPTNAMRVYGRRTDGSSSGPVSLFFGRMLGVYDFQPVQSATVVRLDRDICVVVDRSSSMKLYLTDSASVMSTKDPRFCQPPNLELSRWGALSDAIDEFVEGLEATTQLEYVSLVSYASQYTACSYTNNTSDIHFYLTPSTSQLSSGIAGISSTKFNGMTNIAAGIDDGRTVLNAGARPFAVKTMVLMSDGFWNDGRNPVEAAQDAANEDIIIHTISFGEANLDDMVQIAQITGGRHYNTGNDAALLREAFRHIAFTLPVVMTE